jgi:hypothetical protein
MRKPTTMIAKGRFKTFEEAKAYKPTFGKHVGVRERALRGGKTIYMALVEVKVTNTVTVPANIVGF